MNFDTCRNASLSVYVAPSIDSITPEVVNNRSYTEWPRHSVPVMAGFNQNFNSSSVRRHQFPLANYVALTVDKLMGDTFSKLATAVSSTESRYSLWLTSQLYVLFSRVHELQNLIFVGPKSSTLEAIGMVLAKRN